jgi:hypothetical protein
MQILYIINSYPVILSKNRSVTGYGGIVMVKPLPARQIGVGGSERIILPPPPAELQISILAPDMISYRAEFPPPILPKSIP